VTADVLLHLVADVVLVEPVDGFVQEALVCGQASRTIIPETGRERGQRRWKGIAEQTKSVTILQGTLQSFDPSSPLNSQHTKFLDRVGYQPPSEDTDSGFDVIWCQWCLGHLNDADLVAFLQRSHSALRDRQKGRSLIVVKENLCSNGEDGGARMVFDGQDSSLTRHVLACNDILELLLIVRRKLSDQTWRGRGCLSWLG